MSTMTRASKRAAGTPSPACSGDPDAMFPAADSERPGERNAAELAALAVCAGCALLGPCAEAALSAQMPYGVAGGMTAADRRAIRAVRRGLTEPRDVMTRRSEHVAPVDLERGAA